MCSLKFTTTEWCLFLLSKVLLFQMLMEIRSVASSMTSGMSSQSQLSNIKVALEREVKAFDRREKWVGDYKVCRASPVL